MPVNIHGKSYKTVAERLEEIGDKLKGISTEVLYLDPQIMVRATITTDRGTFTGISAADPSKSIESKTPVEVAETSAVGRALAFAGYAGTEIASADEMVKAVGSQNQSYASKAPEDDLLVPCKECGAGTTYREGISKAGKPYKGYFCTESREHKPYFVK